MAYERLLSAKPTPGPLIPNVKRLSLPLAHLIGNNPIPRLIIGRQLQQLSISGTCENTLTRVNWEEFSTLFTHADVRQSLIDLSISLVDIYGYFTPFYTPCPTRLLSSLAGARQLSRLDLESFRVNDAGTVAMLGLIPNLRVLTFNLDIEHLAKFPEPTAGCAGYFCSIKQIKIVTSSATVVCDLLSQLTASALEVVKVERFSRSSIWDLQDLCSSFALHLPTSSLRSITFCNGIDPYLTRPYNLNTSDLTFDSLKQLFCFTKLERLSISLGAKALLSDGNLMEMGKAWPSLRHLDLYEREFSECSRITPNGIYSLLGLLRRLRHLTVRFNASDPSTYPNIPIMQPHRLRFIDVCTSDAEDSAPIVPYIERLFPTLEYLKWGWVYEHPKIPGSRWETRLDDEELQIRNDDSHECWINTSERLALPRLKRNN